IVIAPPVAATQQFAIVTTDYVTSSTGSVIGTNLALGDTVNVTLAPNPFPFFVDNKGLTYVQGLFDNATDVGVLAPGQEVLLYLTIFTARPGPTPAAATIDSVALRFSRISATVQTTATPQFSVTNVPPIFGFTTPQSVQLTIPPGTVFDYATSMSQVNS